jgi:hypothetical protein
MNQLLLWLSEGDLRSDGLANEVAGIVIRQPTLIGDLIEGLDHPDEAVRGHTSDALEKIGRVQPDLLREYLPRLLACLQTDPVPMVKMHLAMICGHLAMDAASAEEMISVLLPLLHEESVYASSWAIVSLCIFARKYPESRDRILKAILALQGHEKAAVRSRIKKAIALLVDDRLPFPAGWVKSRHLE